MKKIFAILLPVILLMGVSVNVQANSSTDAAQQPARDVGEVFPEYYSESYQQDIENLKQQVAEDMAGMNNNERRVELVMVSMTTYQQQTTYTCGPASGRMVLSSHGIYVSEAQMSSDMNTTTAGTNIGNVAPALNKYVGSGTYIGVTTSDLTFYSGLIASLNRNRPVICNVRTGVLPKYSEDGKNVQHYLVANGQYNRTTVYYSDPHYDNTYYGAQSTSIDNMTQALNNNYGFYVMGQK